MKIRHREFQLIRPSAFYHMSVIFKEQKIAKFFYECIKYNNICRERQYNKNLKSRFSGIRTRYLLRDKQAK